VENKTDIEENTTKGESLKIQCSECNGETIHLVLQSIDTSHVEWIDPQDVYAWSDNYQIVQCQGCKTISFRHLRRYHEYPDLDDGTETLYPERSKKRLSKKDYSKASASLRRIYQETIECFNNEIYTFCATGLRAIVEGICEEQGIKDGPIIERQKDGSSKIVRRHNLYGKISGLSEKDILTSKDSDILHEHRLLGNEAAHELSQPSPEELTLAIEIIEHILDTLYEIPEKAEELRNKKVSRQKKT